MSAPCSVYRHRDDQGQLLYVGMSNNPQRRLWEHKCRSRWADQIAHVDVQWFRDRESAAAAERRAIEGENPIFNGGEDDAPHVPTGDAFRDWMAVCGISQSELADRFGISHSTMSQIISGKRKASLRFACFVEDLSEGEVPVRYWLYGATVQKHKLSRDPVVVPLVARSTEGAA